MQSAKADFVFSSGEFYSLRWGGHSAGLNFSGSMLPDGWVKDERTLFSRDNLVSAFALIMPIEAARGAADDIIAAAGEDAFYTHLSEDMLDLLSLVSDSCAECVRLLNGHTPEVARERRDGFRIRLGAMLG